MARALADILFVSSCSTILKHTRKKVALIPVWTLTEPNARFFRLQPNGQHSMWLRRKIQPDKNIASYYKTVAFKEAVVPRLQGRC